MPPPLALGGCALIVLILLWVERRYESHSSWTLLLPTAWLMIAASRPLGAWFALTRDVQTFDEGSPIDRAVLTALIAFAVVLLPARIRSSSLSVSKQTPVFVLYGFVALTILWSDYPFVSIKRWIRLVGVVPMVLLVLTERDPVAALTRQMRRIGYVLIPFSFVLIKYYPALGRSYSRWSGVLMWNGVTLTKNALGQLCLLTIVALVWATARRMRSESTPTTRPLLLADGFIVMLALYLMLGAPSGAYSATSVAVAVVAVSATILLFRYREAARGLALWLCAGAVAGWLGMVFAQSFAAQTSVILGRDETFTGRTEIWAKALADASANPVLGTGFGSYFNTNNEFTALYGNEGHNGILDVYVECGVMGVAMLLGFLASVFAVSRKTLNECHDFGVLVATVLLTNLLTNFSESLFLKSSSYLWTMLIFVSMLGRSDWWLKPPRPERPSSDVRRVAADARERLHGGGLRREGRQSKRNQLDGKQGCVEQVQE